MLTRRSHVECPASFAIFVDGVSGAEGTINEVNCSGNGNVNGVFQLSFKPCQSEGNTLFWSGGCVTEGTVEAVPRYPMSNLPSSACCANSVNDRGYGGLKTIAWIPPTIEINPSGATAILEGDFKGVMTQDFGAIDGYLSTRNNNDGYFTNSQSVNCWADWQSWSLNTPAIDNILPIKRYFYVVAFASQLEDPLDDNPYRRTDNGIRDCIAEADITNEMKTIVVDILITGLDNVQSADYGGGGVTSDKVVLAVPSDDYYTQGLGGDPDDLCGLVKVLDSGLSVTNGDPLWAGYLWPYVIASYVSNVIESDNCPQDVDTPVELDPSFSSPLGNDYYLQVFPSVSSSYVLHKTGSKMKRSCNEPPLPQNPSGISIVIRKPIQKEYAYQNNVYSTYVDNRKCLLVDYHPAVTTPLDINATASDTVTLDFNVKQDPTSMWELSYNISEKMWLLYLVFYTSGSIKRRVVLDYPKYELYDGNPCNHQEKILNLIDKGDGENGCQYAPSTVSLIVPACDSALARRPLAPINFRSRPNGHYNRTGRFINRYGCGCRCDDAVTGRSIRCRGDASAPAFMSQQCSICTDGSQPCAYDVVFDCDIIYRKVEIAAQTTTLRRKCFFDKACRYYALGKSPFEEDGTVGKEPKCVLPEASGKHCTWGDWYVDLGASKCIADKSIEVCPESTLIGCLINTTFTYQFPDIWLEQRAAAEVKKPACNAGNYDQYVGASVLWSAFGNATHRQCEDLRGCKWIGSLCEDDINPNYNSRCQVPSFSDRLLFEMYKTDDDLGKKIGFGKCLHFGGIYTTGVYDRIFVVERRGTYTLCLTILAEWIGTYSTYTENMQYLEPVIRYESDLPYTGNCTDNIGMTLVTNNTKNDFWETLNLPDSIQLIPSAIKIDGGSSSGTSLCNKPFYQNLIKPKENLLSSQSLPPTEDCLCPDIRNTTAFDISYKDKNYTIPAITLKLAAYEGFSRGVCYKSMPDIWIPEISFGGLESGITGGNNTGSLEYWLGTGRDSFSESSGAISKLIQNKDLTLLLSEAGKQIAGYIVPEVCSDGRQLHVFCFLAQTKSQWSVPDFNQNMFKLIVVALTADPDSIQQDSDEHIYHTNYIPRSGSRPPPTATSCSVRFRNTSTRAFTQQNWGDERYMLKCPYMAPEKTMLFPEQIDVNLV